MNTIIHALLLLWRHCKQVTQRKSGKQNLYVCSLSTITETFTVCVVSGPINIFQFVSIITESESFLNPPVQ